MGYAAGILWFLVLTSLPEKLWFLHLQIRRPSFAKGGGVLLQTKEAIYFSLEVVSRVRNDRIPAT